MRIANELKTGKVELILLEAQKEYFPSYKIQIRVETENFRANFDKHIWISDADVHQFLIELEALDKYRTGQATLKTFLPEECRLTFQPIDSLGHLSVILYHRQDE